MAGRVGGAVAPVLAVAAVMLASGALLQAFVTGTPARPDIAPPAAGRFLGSEAPHEAPAPAAAALVAGAAALVAAGAVVSRRATVTRRAATEFAGGLIGNQSALNKEWNFDPLNLSTRCEKFLPWFREAELKHGRIAMLAWVGLVVPDIFRFPMPDGEWFSSCKESANVVVAHDACYEPGGIGPLYAGLCLWGITEMLTTVAKCAEGLTLENAGDYQLGTNFLPKEEDKKYEMKLKELKNGRLAMLAFGGAITQATLTGNGFPWLYAQRSSASSAGLSSSVPSSKSQSSSSRATRSRMTARAEAGGYKMSKAVPFLPVSPALEGYVGCEEEGFDPMGFSLAIDIRWLREAELKHARVAMLATVGWIATDMGLRVPGAPFQVSTIEAHDAMVKFGAMPQMLVWMGYLELFGFLAIINMMEGKTDRKPGDFGIRLLYPGDAQGQYQMQLKELRNGRLAMLAFGGIATTAVLTGGTWPFVGAQATNSNTSSSSTSTFCGNFEGASSKKAVTQVRALEASKSLPFLPKPQNLAGFVGEEQEFDPLGFSDTFDMKWLREAELKHGRVCMVATVGFFAQQFITFPGFKETPDALQAVYTCEPGGMATLLFIAGYIESTTYNGKMTMLDMFDGTEREPGNFEFGSGMLKGKSEEDVKTMKLKELQNGRLAMFAIGGMVHHNLVVKGPLFPLFPDGWEGPQGSWGIEDQATASLFSMGMIGNELAATWAPPS